MRNAEAIDDGHAAGKFALRFDVEEMLRLRSDDRRIERGGHSNRIGQRDAVLAGLLEVGFLGAAVALDGEIGDWWAKAENVLDVGWIERGLAAAEVPADEFDGQPTAHDDAGGFWIAPDVVLGGGSYIAFAAWRAAHDDAAADFRDDAGPLLQGQRDVGERAERDYGQAWVRFDCVDDGVEGVLFFRSAAWGRVAVIAEAIAAVKPVGRGVCSLEWFFRAYKHRHLRATKFRGVKSVAGGLLNMHVSRDRGDGQNLDLRGAQRHDQGDSVVGGCVGIDEEFGFHAP